MVGANQKKCELNNPASFQLRRRQLDVRPVGRRHRGVSPEGRLPAPAVGLQSAVPRNLLEELGVSEKAAAPRPIFGLDLVLR